MNEDQKKKSKPMMRASLFRLLDEQRSALSSALRDPSIKSMTPAENRKLVKKLNALKTGLTNTTARIANNASK